MLNLAWGGFANGGAALEAVCVQAVGGIPGDLLEPTTAAAWSGWRAAIAARTGVWLQLDHSDLIAPGLRDVPNQQLAWDRYQTQGRPVASHPPDATHQGSNHGWGRALDVTGFENRPDVWQAMNDLAPQFGLSNVTGSASGERWHWECTNPPTTVAFAGATTIIERTDDDEMITPDGLKQLQTLVRAEILNATTTNLYRNSVTGSIAVADVSKGFWREFASMPDLNTLKSLGVFDPDENLQNIDPSLYSGIKGECIAAAKQFLRFAQTGK